MTIHIESETEEHPVERCDHGGTTEPLNGLASISTVTSARHIERAKNDPLVAGRLKR